MWIRPAKGASQWELFAMNEEDEIRGFDDITVRSNDGYVVLDQFCPALDQESTVIIPHYAVEAVIRAMRKHKRLALQSNVQAESW
jgi:hypothetical protein